MAFARCAEERPSASLVVVGFDSAREAWQGRAEELGIARRTRFLGGRQDAEACYAAADLYVLPTRYDPFANSTLEALASGLPVITTETNGGSEVLTEAAGTVLARDRDEDALARALVEWTAGERLESARSAARAVAEEHGQERTVAESTRVLEACAAERAATGSSRA